MVKDSGKYIDATSLGHGLGYKKPVLVSKAVWEGFFARPPIVGESRLLDTLVQLQNAHNEKQTRRIFIMAEVKDDAGGVARKQLVAYFDDEIYILFPGEEKMLKIKTEG